MVHNGAARWSVSVRGIMVRVESQDFQEILASLHNCAHFLCDSDGMEFRPVGSAPAVNEFPAKAFVEVELLPTQGSQLDASRQDSVAFVLPETEPLRLENRVVQIEAEGHLSI